MALLNINNTPHLWTPHNRQDQQIVYKDSPAHLKWVNDTIQEKGDCFFIEFMWENAFSIYDLATVVEPNILEKIKRGEATLILANSGHGYHENVEGVYKDVIIKHSINPKNIILRSESFDMLEEIEIISKKYNLPMCRYEWVTEFEHQMKDYVLYTDHALPLTLQKKSYNKKFISFNGVYRPHRGAIVAMLAAMNLLDYGVVSYNAKGPSDMTGIKNYELLKTHLSYNEEFNELIESSEKIIRNLDRIIIDIEEGTNIDTSNVLSHHKDWYESTYFSLVTETSIPLKPFSPNSSTNTDTGRILSEKIFKPVALRHPFLVVSNPKVLELFRSLGYKTFSPLIDESYDDEVDTAKRFLMIVKEVKRLSELNSAELDYFLIEAGKICDYNLEVLKNKNNYIHPLN